MKSSVRNTAVAAAVAAVLGSSAAFALPPTATYQYTFYAGGGSAQTNAAFWAITQSLLPGTIDSYTPGDNGNGNSGNYRIITGTTAAAYGAVPQGSNIQVFYKFNGGSFPNGVQPQAVAGTTLAYPVGISGATAIPGAAYPNPTYLLSAAGAATTNNQIPDWGVADLEVGIFNYPDNLGTATPLTATQISNTAKDGIYDSVFALAVSNALYAVKSNFTKQEVVGILTGQFTDWVQLNGDNGSPLPEQPMVFLDRGAGSGSKAAGNQYFLANPGAFAIGGSKDPGSVTNGYTGTTLALPLTAGVAQDVKESSSGTVVTDLQRANAAGVYAFAILGAEFPPAGNQVGGVNQYSFAKINGVGIDTGTTGDNINGPHGGTSATKYTNVVLGGYDFFYQNSFNTRAGFLTNGTANAGFTNEIKTKLQLKDISGANASLAFPNAVPGLLLDPVVLGVTSGYFKGEVTGTRKKNSTSPLAPVFDATTALTLGSDPL